MERFWSSEEGCFRNPDKFEPLVIKAVSVFWTKLPKVLNWTKIAKLNPNNFLERVCVIIILIRSFRQVSSSLFPLEPRGYDWKIGRRWRPRASTRHSRTLWDTGYGCRMSGTGIVRYGFHYRVNGRHRRYYTSSIVYHPPLHSPPSFPLLCPSKRQPQLPITIIFISFPPLAFLSSRSSSSESQISSSIWSSRSVFVSCILLLPDSQLILQVVLSGIIGCYLSPISTTMSEPCCWSNSLATGEVDQWLESWEGTWSFWFFGPEIFFLSAGWPLPSRRNRPSIFLNMILLTFVQFIYFWS